MANPGIRPSRMVIAVDDSDFAQGVVEGAFDAATRMGAADMHFLRVVEARRPSLRDHGGEVDEAHVQLGELIHEALVNLGGNRDRSGWSVRVHVGAGDPAEEVLSLAADVEADYIVIGRWSNRKPKRDRLGAVGARVLAGAGCTVLMHQPTDYGEHELIDRCDACLALRRDSRGERWFCGEHAGEHAFRSTTLMASAFTPTGGASQF